MVVLSHIFCFKDFIMNYYNALKVGVILRLWLKLAQPEHTVAQPFDPEKVLLDLSKQRHLLLNPTNNQRKLLVDL